MALNFYKGSDIRELTICGMHIGVRGAEMLAKGLSNGSSVKKIRLNFCIKDRKVLQALMPGLANPNKVPLEELDLSANGMLDSECGELVAKILIAHCEARDEVLWQYALRNELPPRQELRGLKKYDLSFNKFGFRTALGLAKALKTDQNLRQMNLRSNLIPDEGVVEFLDYLYQNESLLNLDLRDNIGFKTKSHRKLALKMLQNYTLTEKKLK